MITITVTERHLEEGVPTDCKRCAIAIAVRDVIDPRFAVEAGQMQLFLLMPPDHAHLWFGRFPEHVIIFIREWDQGHAVDLVPRTFTMEIPQQYLRPELRTIEEQ